MDVGSSVKSAVKWMGISKAASQIVAWALTIITIRFLNPADYGLIALAGISLSFVQLFGDAGLYLRLVQKRDLDLYYIRQVFGIAIVVGIFLTLLLMGLAPLIADSFSEPRLTDIIRALSLTLIISSFGLVPDAMLARRLDFKAIMMFDMVSTIIASTLVCLLAFLGWGAWALVVGSLTGAILRVIRLYYLSPFPHWPIWSLAGIGETLRFGGLVTLQRVLGWYYNWIDRFLLGRAYSAEIVGYYSVALHLAELPHSKIGSILVMATNAGMARVAGDRPAMAHHLLQGIRVLALAMLPVCLGISVTAPDLIPVVLGQKWLPSIVAMQALCFAIPLRMIHSPIGESLNAVDQTAIATVNTLITAVIVTIGVVIGLQWGFEGVAWGWVASYPFAFLITLVRAKRVLGLGIWQFTRAILPATVCASLMYGVVAVARPFLPWPVPSISGLAASVALGVLVYGLAILIADRPTLRTMLSILRG